MKYITRSICTVLVLTCCTVWGSVLRAQTPVDPKLDLVLLVENSQQVASYLPPAKLKSLRSGDRVAVVVFGATQSAAPFVSDVKSVMRTLRHVSGSEFAEKVRLWDALDEAANLFTGSPDPGRRRAVIVLASGFDDSRQFSATTALKSLRKSGAKLDVVSATRARSVPSGLHIPNAPSLDAERYRASTSPLPRPFPSAVFDLVKLADATGGKTVGAETDLNRLIDELRR